MEFLDDPSETTFQNKNAAHKGSALRDLVQNHRQFQCYGPSRTPSWKRNSKTIAITGIARSTHRPDESIRRKGPTIWCAGTNGVRCLHAKRFSKTKTPAINHSKIKHTRPKADSLATMIKTSMMFLFGRSIIFSVKDIGGGHVFL